MIRYFLRSSISSAIAAVPFLLVAGIIGTLPAYAADGLIDGWQDFEFLSSVENVEKELESQNVEFRSGLGIDAPYSVRVSKGFLIEDFMVFFNFSDDDLIWIRLSYYSGDTSYSDEACAMVYEKTHKSLLAKYSSPSYDPEGSTLDWKDEKVSQWLFPNGNLIELKFDNIKNIRKCHLSVNYYHASIISKLKNPF